MCRCQALVSRGWGVFREKWGGLHPLSRARRLQTLASLQPLAEMQVEPHFFTTTFKFKSMLLLTCSCCQQGCACAAASVDSSLHAVHDMLDPSMMA